jgi:hypothetical protein
MLKLKEAFKESGACKTYFKKMINAAFAYAAKSIKMRSNKPGNHFYQYC